MFRFIELIPRHARVAKLIYFALRLHVFDSCARRKYHGNCATHWSAQEDRVRGLVDGAGPLVRQLRRFLERPFQLPEARLHFLSWQPAVWVAVQTRSQHDASGHCSSSLATRVVKGVRPPQVAGGAESGTTLLPPLLLFRVLCSHKQTPHLHVNPVKLGQRQMRRPDSPSLKTLLMRALARKEDSTFLATGFQCVKWDCGGRDSFAAHACKAMQFAKGNNCLDLHDHCSLNRSCGVSLPNKKAPSCS